MALAPIAYQGVTALPMLNAGIHLLVLLCRKMMLPLDEPVPGHPFDSHDADGLMTKLRDLVDYITHPLRWQVSRHPANATRGQSSLSTDLNFVRCVSL